MAIKVYISGICGSHEVRKHQQRVLFILQSLPIDLQLIDITEPGKEDDLIFMQEEAKKHNKKTQLPPQIFNDNEYCGDYADFELANDDDEIMKFLKLETSSSKSGDVKEAITQNGINDSGNKEENLSESILSNGKVNGESNDVELNETADEATEEKDTIINSSEREENAFDEIKNAPEEEHAHLSEEEKSEEESE